MKFCFRKLIVIIIFRLEYFMNIKFWCTYIKNQHKIPININLFKQANNFSLNYFIIWSIFFFTSVAWHNFSYFLILNIINCVNMKYRSLLYSHNHKIVIKLPVIEFKWINSNKNLFVKMILLHLKINKINYSNIIIILYNISIEIIIANYYF